jgi:YVTN family beta-propeller protein
MRLISSIFLIVLVATSCKKSDPTIKDSVPLHDGMMVLCEGLYQQNNSTLSYVNFNTNQALNDFFLNTSKRALGDTGNDMKRYGGKVYVIVNGSSTVEVISGVTGITIKQISMMNNGVPKQPRSVAFYEDKILVSCYDGFVDVIDTTTYQIEQRIQVGSNPEGLAVSNDKLYVANSGGLNYPNLDSTVSVVNLSTFTEETKITVGLNPSAIEVDDQGDIYVITRGDFAGVPSRLNKINPTTLDVTHFTFDASSIVRMNGNFLIGYADFSTSNNQVAVFNPTTDAITNSTLLDLSGVQTLYGLAYHPIRDRIYVVDAMDFVTTGYVFEFDPSSGAQTNSFHVGLNPSKIVFYD